MTNDLKERETVSNIPFRMEPNMAAFILWGVFDTLFWISPNCPNRIGTEMRKYHNSPCKIKLGTRTAQSVEQIEILESYKSYAREFL